METINKYKFYDCLLAGAVVASGTLVAAVGALGGYYVSSSFTDNTAVKVGSIIGFSFLSVGICTGASIYGLVYYTGTYAGKIAGEAIVRCEQHKQYKFSCL